MKLVSKFYSSTSIIDSLKCRLSNDVEHLVQVKRDALEVSSIQPHGLQHECRWEGAWGNILSVRAIPTGDGRSNLIVLLDHPEPELIFLTFTANELKVTKCLDIAEQKPTAEFCDHNSLVVHPDGKLAVVSCYTGKLRCIRLKRGNYDSDSDAQITEYVILSLAFLPPTPDERYTIALLHLDPERRVQLRAHAVDIKDLDISRDVSDVLVPTSIPWKILPIPEAGDPVPMLIPVGRPAAFQDLRADEEGDPSTFIGGVLVVGGSKVLLYELSGESGRAKQQNKRRRLEEGKTSRFSERREKVAAKETERQKRKRKPKAVVDWPWSQVTSHYMLEDEPQRLIIGDSFGRLAMLSLHDVPNHGLVLIPLGETSPPTSLTYLTNGVLFVGSHAGDSQLVQISDEPLPSSSKAPAVPTLPIPYDIETVPASRLAPPAPGEKADEVRNCILEGEGSYLRVIKSFKNIAPILDAEIVDTDGTGHLQIVTCSGGQNTGSIHVIRKGADFQQLGTVSGMQNLMGVFALKRMYDDKFQSHILISTLDSSQALEIQAPDKLNRVDSLSGGFVSGRTFAARNIQHAVVRPAVRRGGKEIQPATVSYKGTSFVVQVTKTGAFLLDFEMESTWEKAGEIKPDTVGGGVVTGLEIVAADINSTQTVLALSNGALACLELNDAGNALQATRQTPMPLAVDISAVSCAPFDPRRSTSDIVAVAYWQSNQIQLLDLANAEHPFRHICTTQSLPAVVRSLLLFEFNSSSGVSRPHLLAGLGDGSLAIFAWDPELRVLAEPKLMSLGVLPVALTPYTLPDGKRAVLATGSRAAVLTWERDRVQSSPVMLKDVMATTQLHSEFYESSLLLANESALFIAQVRDVDSMHIRSIPSGLDVPQKIVYEPSLKVFGVAFLRSKPTRVGVQEPAPQSFFRLLDDSTFTQISELEFKEADEITCVTILPIGKEATPCFAVGSYIVNPQESEPTSGCLRILSAHPIGADPRSSSLALEMLASADVNGCLYSIATINGMIAVGVNSAVLLFRLDIDVSTRVCTLHQLSKMNTNYFVTSLSSYENRIFIGDRISSLSLVESMGDLRLGPISRDLTPLSPVCVQAVDGKHVLAANDTLNLLSFTFDEKTRKLDRDGYYHLSDLVNKFVAGSITGADASSSFKPMQMFFTSSGQIGIIMDITDDQLALDLTDLQRNLYGAIESGDRQKRFRTPQSSARRRVADEAYGFLDGDFLERLLSTSGDQLLKIEAGSNEPERLKRPIADFQQLLKTLQSLH
ncbi:mono-functional DNA-alkylating methyl methanesulfonate N-term-domain-containing protein [Mycena amicta]|nr:mono-functional DNA-alkylating methyl methanesulfonate N-term-domain-containing protein [Mycena amicta]